MDSLKPPGGPLLDVTEIAQYLGVPERWARRVVAERRIETVKLGRRVKITKAALDDFIEASTRPANGSAVPPGLVSISTKARSSSKRSQSAPARAKGQSRAHQ